jgi:hypothetical protein
VLEVVDGARTAGFVVKNLAVVEHGIALIPTPGVSKHGHQGRFSARQERLPDRAEIDRQERVTVGEQKGLVENALVEREP